jgi:anaerobic selenocysteine-containing dehydrogenase
LLMTAPKAFRENAARIGFEPGIDQGDRIFQALLDSSPGVWVGRADTDNCMAAVRTPSGKIEVYIPEMEDLAKSLDAVGEADDLKMSDEFPLILNAGRHMDTNANTLMRNPEWNKGRRACTIALSIRDAQALSLIDGQQVRVTTVAGSAEGELQVSGRVRPGTVLIPHGFGLVYEGKVFGINVNRLTKNTHRDPLGTPLHRFIPCRVEAA